MQRQAVNEGRLRLSEAFAVDNETYSCESPPVYELQSLTPGYLHYRLSPLTSDLRTCFNNRLPSQHRTDPTAPPETVGR